MVPGNTLRQSNRWLFLHAPQLLLDFQLTLQAPAQQQQPQALVCQQRQCLLQLNSTARQAGLHPGQSLAVARSLCAELEVRPYQELQEQQLLRQLAHAFYQDIAQIALFPPQGLLFEVRSLQRLYGSLAQLQQRLQQRLQHWQLTASLASGFSPLAAQLLAQAGVNIVTGEAELVTAQLGLLPLSKTTLTPEVQKRLTGVGIQHVAALLALPASSLSQRFGKPMSHYLAALRGQVQAPQHYYRPPPYFYQRVDLLSEISDWPRLVFVLKRMLKNLEDFLCARQLCTRELIIEAHHRNKEYTRLHIRFAHDSWQQADMLSLCQLHMERQPLKTPALELSLKVTRLRPLRAEPQDMLTTGHGRWTPAELLSRLQARLGETAVYRLALTSEQRPDRAQQSVRASQKASTVTVRSRVRPLWLLTEPEPVVINEFTCQWGPERIDSGWWDNHHLQRDYYIGLDAHARQAWLFKDQRGWFLHGWFG